MAKVSTRGTFAPGSKVKVHRRTTDFFESEPLGKAVKTGKVGAHGDAEFSGLPLGERYWIVGEAQGHEAVVAATAKGEDGAPQAEKAPARKSRAAKPRRATQGRAIVDGARSTASVRKR